MAETDHRLWRVLFHHVGQAHQRIAVSAVTQLTVDETSVRRGHNYVTVVCEPGCLAEQRTTRVLFVARAAGPGRSHRHGIFWSSTACPPSRFAKCVGT